MTRRQLVALVGLPLRAQLLKKTPLPPGVAAKLRPPPQYSFNALPIQPRTGNDKSQLDAIGKHRAFPSAALGKGRWDRVPDGNTIWRLSIKSPNATGIRIHFEKFDVGGATVWVHSGLGSNIRVSGPYAAKGPEGTGSFWSDTLAADQVTIEYAPIVKNTSNGPLPFVIHEITHLFDL